MESLTTHWDKIYNKTESSNLGWYEDNFNQTIGFLNRIINWDTSTMFIAGAGSSKLADQLLHKNIKLILNDISSEGLKIIKDRIGENAAKIKWICQDISKSLPSDTPMVDIWVDRAVLHFLTNEADIMGYFRNLNSYLKIGGHVLFAEFSNKGALKCAGLPIHQYSIVEFDKYLGNSYTLIDQLEWVFTNPKGEPRPYIYALYKKIKNEG